MPKSISISIIILLMFGSACNRHLSEKRNVKHDAFKESVFQKPSAWVNDYEKVFTVKQFHHLDSVCNAYEQSSGKQIFIVTTASIEPYTSLREFTTSLANYWKIGQAKKNNGLMICFSKLRREVWIGTGLGTQEILTDEILQGIVDKKMLPQFKTGAYFQGISDGLEACIANWN